jgi:hypothetical protein
LVPLLTGIGAAGTIGTTAYQLASGGASTPKTTTTNTAANQAALDAQRKAALLAQSGNTQSQTGGSLTPTAFAATSAKAAGVPSDLNSIMQSLGGTGSSAPISGGITTPNSGTAPDPNNLQNLSDLLKG